MKKIMILGFAKIKLMPYLHFYLEALSGQEAEIHLLYWNRDGKKEDLSRYQHLHLHELGFLQQDDVPQKDKIAGFRRYRRFAKKLISREKPDFLILLHSFPAVLLSDLLLKKYRGRFIWDYRDHTYEHFSFFRRLVGRIVEASACTFVSSDAFRPYLPARCGEKIHTSHNISLDSLEHRDDRKTRFVPSEKIRVAFWGIVRDEALNRTIISRFAADPRFEMHYYGREQQAVLDLKRYGKELRAENVFFHGEYQAEDRYDFACRTDLIHNLYQDRNMMLAMSNKYYDGAVFRLPQLCVAGSFMGKIAADKGIGLCCDPADPGFTQQVYDYYTGLDRSAFEEACDRETKRVKEEYDASQRIIRKYVAE